MVTMYETIERPLIPVLLGMEQAGVKVDAPLLKRLSADFEKRMGELEREIHKLAGREFNVGSPKQLGEILFDEQKLPGGRRSKTGAWSTDAAILDELAAQGHALPVKILEHRQIAKLKGTYTDALVRELDARTGRIHTSYMMTGAATGRLASTEPNLQNIPVRTEEGRKIREAFIAETGHKLVSADYSQIELRLLAHVADLASLKEAFRARRRHPCHHRLGDVRRAGQGHGPAGPPPRQGDQLRHHLRHLGVRPRQPARHRPARGARLHRQVLPALSRASATTWSDQGVRAQERLREDAVRPQDPSQVHQRQEPGHARLLRARRDQRALAGRRRRHHQARHDPPAAGAEGRPSRRPACCCRCTTSCCSRCPTRRSRRSRRSRAR
jgi:DNA polymerase-1